MSENNGNENNYVPKLFREDVDYQISDETKKLMEDAFLNAEYKIRKFHDGMMDTLHIDEFNIIEKNKMAVQLTLSWCTTLYGENSLLNKLEKKREEVKQNYIENLGINEKYFVLENKAEKECLALKKIDKAIEEQKSVVLFLKEANKIMKDFSWNIKNTIDLMKIESM